MEKLIIKYDDLHVPRAMCTIDRFGEADDCDTCEEMCGECHTDCKDCPIQQVFERLAEYEATGITPEQIREIDKLYRDHLKEIEDLKRAAGVNSERDKVFKQCLHTYGADPQIDMTLEEMAELSKALLKNRRSGGSDPKCRDNIVDELADVRIMVRQMEILFQCEDEVESRIDYKVQRQARRLKERNEQSTSNTI